MEDLVDWQQVLLWSGVVSVGAVLATLAAVPWVIEHLPHDYFNSPRREHWGPAEGAPLFTSVLEIAKNIVGGVLVLLGAIMLLTPGQGVLTILAGLLLMNFPGKYRLERWLVLRPGVLRALNWLRDKRGQPPFDAPGGVGLPPP
ncbi:MAG: PGPGW domain-containing protein [Halioglobus sp.]|nr:PGPGW domain-containing protein [Halioglobus sp.]